MGDPLTWIPKPESLAEYNIDACHIDDANSEVIHLEYMNDQHFYNIHPPFEQNIILTSNIPGVSDIFTVTFTKLRNQQKCCASFSWLEYY
jgi:aspartyl/asparaginyl-tRNA synthetase